MITSVAVASVAASSRGTTRIAYDMTTPACPTVAATPRAKPLTESLVLFTGAFNPPNQQATHNAASQPPGSESLGQNNGAAPQLTQMQQLQLLAAANANQGNMPDGNFSSGMQGLGGLDTSLWNYNLPNNGGLPGGMNSADMIQQQVNMLQQQAELERGRFDPNMQNLSAMDRGFINQLQGSAFGGGLAADGMGNGMPGLGDGLDALGLGNLCLGNQQALSNAALAARINALQNGYGGNLGSFAGGDYTGGQGQGGLLNGLNPGLLQNNMNGLPLQQQLQLRELQNLSQFGQTPQLQVSAPLPRCPPCILTRQLNVAMHRLQSAKHCVLHGGSVLQDMYA